MQAKKLAFANDVSRVVHSVCELAFNIHSEERFHDVFGINYAKMDEIIQKIVTAIPDKIFDHGLPGVVDELKSICAREFVFFQVQERCDDARYEGDLTNFINILVRDIQQRVNLMVKEEQQR